MSKSNKKEDAIVIDCGSGVCKAGIGGDDLPRTVFSAVVGRCKEKSLLIGSSSKDNDAYIGDEAQLFRGLMSINYPIVHGLVKNWDDAELLWQQCFYDLGMPPTEHPLLLTDAPSNPKVNRERTTQIAFEKFQTCDFFIAIQALLPLYALGRGTGVVLDTGDGVTHVVPIFEGYALTHAIQRIDIAGADLTEYLANLLTQRGYSFKTSFEREIVKDIKEKLSLVSIDYLSEAEALMKDKELEKEYEEVYELPDGEKVLVGSEKFKCPEVLFQPNLIGKEVQGIHELVWNSVLKCETDIRRELIGNVLLSGGTSMFEGLPERLTKEIMNLAPTSMRVKVNAPPERKYTVWIGGSIMTSMSTFSDMWISKDDYEEFGPGVVHRKCL
jgi:actin